MLPPSRQESPSKNCQQPGFKDADFEPIRLRVHALEFSGCALGDGPLVLLLHGFPDNVYTWRHQLPALAQAGYRGVAVHLRGYDPGSQPGDGDYSLDTLAKDPAALLDALGIERAHLVGHDWGAIVSYRAAALNPQRFSSLTTIAVPHDGRFLSEAWRHARQLRLSWYILFFQMRGLADPVLARQDFALIRMLWRQWSPGWDIPEAALESVIETFRQPGVARAALAYYRTAVASSLPLSPRARRAAAYTIPVPTLALTGSRDRCIDSAVFRQMMRERDFPGGLEIRQIPGAGHFVQQEKPDHVNRLLLDWLDRHN